MKITHLVHKYKTSDSDNHTQGATTFSMMTFSIMSLSVMTLSIMIFSIMSLIVMVLNIIIRKIDTQHNDNANANAECH